MFATSGALGKLSRAQCRARAEFHPRGDKIKDSQAATDSGPRGPEEEGVPKIRGARDIFGEKDTLKGACLEVLVGF